MVSVGDITTVLLQIKQLERRYEENVVLSFFYTQPHCNVCVLICLLCQNFLASEVTLVYF